MPLVKGKISGNDLSNSDRVFDYIVKAVQPARKAVTGTNPKASHPTIAHPTRDFAMRFMVMVKAAPESEKEGAVPDPQQLLEMGKYNEELSKAGVLLALHGLHPSSKGARVKFSGKSRTVIDGPFTEAKELIAGFSMLQVKSLQEAIEWVKRSPTCSADDYEVEIRQVFEMEDFAPILSQDEIQHKV